MKHIATDNVVSVTANSADINFPAEQVMDEHPRRVWKTSDDVSKATLKVGVVGGASDILIAGTNAETATISAEDPNEMMWGDGDTWGYEVDSFLGNHITNGNFATSPVSNTWDYDSTWWHHVSSMMWFYCGTDEEEKLTQTNTLISGRTYRVTYTLSNTNPEYGSVQAELGDARGQKNNTDGTFSEIFIATGTDFSIVGIPGSLTSYVVAAIDNVFVYEVDSESHDIWANVGLGSITAEVTQNAGSSSLWLTLSEAVATPSDLTITLQGLGGESLYVGVVRAGTARTYGRNPSYGLIESRLDFSIYAENSNGSLYYKKRDVVRTFNLNATMLRDQAQLLVDVFSDVGKEPTSWRLTDLDSSDWVVFGMFSSAPTITHSSPSHSVVEWAITEVL